jgi:hypothetical protein
MSSSPLNKIFARVLKGFTLLSFLLFILGFQFLSNARAQQTSYIIDLTFNTAQCNECDTLLIQIQVSTDMGFKNIIHQSEWIKCSSNEEFTYSVEIPLIQGSFYWRGRHKNSGTEDISDWSSPFRFYLLLDPGALVPGDVNGDRLINVSDLIYLVNYFMRTGPPPTPYEAGDIKCDGGVTLSDLIYLINYIFRGGPAPGC